MVRGRRLIGGDRLAEAILDKQPRTRSREPNAMMWIDAAGRLNVLDVVNGGLLIIAERELKHVHGDDLIE